MTTATKVKVHNYNAGPCILPRKKLYGFGSGAACFSAHHINVISVPRVRRGQLKEHGTAVILAAEDSYETIHRRFNKIDEADKRVLAGDRLIVVPMPSVGGPRPLIDVENGVPQKTEFFYDFKAQLLELPDLKLVVIDPLQAFNMADVTSDPAAAQFMWSALAEICAETGATIIVTHHMRKEGMHNTSVAGAR